uniref:Putative myosin class ii heavy chain n=1 Tax=Culex tarsalis TaxID=7177 RepID=A0A1Q3G3E5_CULTA
MDIDTLHADLRKRLDILGFNHSLPLGAIGIVSAILSDLIKTSEKLKSSKQQIEQLMQEKAAWELGVEPYKCDNSRLLSEVNGLHLELVKQRDKFVLVNTELKCRVRSLQTDKKQLDERCLQAEAKIRELLHSADSKSRKNGVNMQRKPFVSTVRAGYYQPPKCCDAQAQDSKCHCPCNQPRKTDVLHEIERLQAETKNQEEVIDAYKKQIEYRDREIQRLGALFAGGRPVAALAKDCCYRSANTLNEDVGKLQEEKLAMQHKLSEAMASQESSSKKIQKLSDRNRQLEQELKEIENVALSVESEANLNILDKERANSDLQIRLQQSSMRIKELETILEAKGSGGFTPISSSASACSLDSTLQNALKQANEEKRALYKQLNELKQREHALLCDYEKVKTKYSKLKLKLSSQIAFGAENVGESADASELKQKLASLEDRLKDVQAERDQCSGELQRLRDSIAKLKGENTEKDLRIAQLESELCLQKKTGASSNTGRLRTADSTGSGQKSLSVQAVFHRVERERDAAKREAQQLEIERDSLRNKLKLATKSQIDEQAKHEETIIGYSGQIAKLEAEKRDLLCGQSSSQTTVHLLREENRDLQERLKDVESHFSKLRVSHSQLKILQEQTERALAQHQDRLMCYESQLGSAEAKLNQVDGTIDCANKDIGKLRGDVSVLRASNAALQREKDKLLIELDKKTEKLFTVETELSNLKASKSGMRDTIDRLQRKLENASTDNIQKESTLRSVATETDTLRKQVATLKRSHDNAVAENGRLSNELSDAGSELTLTKRKLADCQQEVERMKSQLREYVQEIQRAEELLCVKEREREEMLEHYKSLSEGVNMLEVSNHTLEAESAEAKKLLQEAEGRINGLQEQVGLRQSEIKTYEKQINELSANIVSLESEVDCLKEENQHLREDLEATKDLCNKLDLQKDKLNEELNEHSSIREQLNRENATLKRQLSLANTGDKAAVDGLQELLAASRSEVEQQRIVTSQLSQEVKSLKDQVSELGRKLEEERDRATRSEATANEYSVQLQELRRMITDDRFAQVQSRDEDDYNSIKAYLNAVQNSFSTLSSAVSVGSSRLDPRVSESPQVNCHSEKGELDNQVSEKESLGNGSYPRWMQDASGRIFTESETGRLMKQYLVPSGDQNGSITSEQNQDGSVSSSDIEVLLDKNHIILSDEQSCNRHAQCDSEQSEAPPGWKILDYQSSNVKRNKKLSSKSSKTKQNQSSQEMLTGRVKSSIIVEPSSNTPTIAQSLPVRTNKKSFFGIQKPEKIPDIALADCRKKSKQDCLTNDAPTSKRQNSHNANESQARRKSSQNDEEKHRNLPSARKEFISKPSSLDKKLDFRKSKELLNAKPKRRHSSVETNDVIPAVKDKLDHRKSRKPSSDTSVINVINLSKTVTAGNRKGADLQQQSNSSNAKDIQSAKKSSTPKIVVTTPKGSNVKVDMMSTNRKLREIPQKDSSRLTVPNRIGSFSRRPFSATSAPRLPKTPSPMKGTPVQNSPDLLVREASSYFFNRVGTLPELDFSKASTPGELEVPTILRDGEPSINLESTVLESGEEKSINGQAKPPERGYEEFRKSLIQNSRKKASSLSVQAGSEERKPSQKTSSDVGPGPSASVPAAADDDDEKPQKPDPELANAGCGGSKIDERGSTVVIYKNALGERLIVADAGQNRPQPPHEESDYKTATAWDSSSSSSSSCSILVIDDMRQSSASAPIRTPGGRAAAAASNDSNEKSRSWREIFEHQLSPRGTNDDRKRTINYELSRDSAGDDATTTAIVTQRIKASLNDEEDGAGGGARRDGMKPTLVLKCDPKTYVLNLKIKVPRDSEEKKNKQQQTENNGSKK